MRAVKVTDNVYWVGAIDWNVRNFHGYATNFGTTYNAFLVIDRKVTLIDTVKAPFFDEMMRRVSSVIDPAKIDYIVSNHAEMDHSGSLPAAVAAIRPERIFASAMGEKALKAHFRDLPEITVVGGGDTLELGAGSLHFAETRMLHWPDSMVSYLDSEKVLFSQDAFGMHLAGTSRFYEDYEEATLVTEAKKYFANILLLQAPKVLELLKTLPTFNFDIRIIAPDHGPIWRGDGVGRILELYAKMASPAPGGKAVVVYDTMWHSTETMAAAVVDGITSRGIVCDSICLANSDRSYAMTKLLDAGIVVVGSPTLNNHLYPTVADFLTYMKGLKRQSLVGGAFGSFGWSGEAVKQVGDYLSASGVETPFPPVKVKYVPAEADLTACRELGEKLADLLLEKLK